MAIADNIKTAEALTRIGVAVFPVYVKPDPENPYRTTKKPGIKEGVYGATLDPGYVYDLFEKHPKAEVGVWMGASGLVAADIDVKRDPEGNVLVDGFEEFEREFLDLPETHNFDSVSGAGGKQYLYAAPEGVNLGPAGNYRGIKGVDRRGGGSYSVWQGPVPTSRNAFAPAPDWLLDESKVRSAEHFEGTVKDWYEGLEPGEPNVVVRAAMDRTRKAFEQAGNDFDHAAVIERQFEAVRLGAEGHPGVPALLELIEELFLTRTGSHSRPEAEWAHEFQEGLASGIKKYGDAIELRKNLPPYEIGMVPASIPERLLVGDPGDKETFRELLSALLASVDDDLVVTSILWNAPRTRDIAREWGLEFVHARVQAARTRPEPVRENPTLDTPKPMSEGPRSEFLTPDENEFLSGTRTYIDKYLDGSKTKGFYTKQYAIPAAWTAMSMAFGCKAFIPKGINIGMNMWFIVLGYSGTGKSSEDDFLTNVLDAFLRDGGDTYYNLGAGSSPQGLHEALLQRDNLASIIHHDEASDFFEDLRKKDWMSSLKDLFAKWYVGKVDPSNTLRLKELRGKSAHTSFNIHMLGTPDRLTGLLDTDMFRSGFLARFNWLWAPPAENDDYKYEGTLTAVGAKHVNPVVFDLASDLAHAGSVLGSQPIAMGATPEAMERLKNAFRAFDKAAHGHEKYDAIEPAVTRLGRETLWKCAALVALYDGRTIIEKGDALVAIQYATEWYHTLIRVVETTSEGEFSADVNEIENWIKAQGGEVTQARLNHRFRSMIRYSPRELQDRIDFLVISGRVNRQLVDNGKRLVYVLNGTAE